MKRNPFVHWLFIMLTGGLYAFIWAYLIARDANKVASAQVINLRKYVIITATLFGLYLPILAFGSINTLNNVEVIKAGNHPPSDMHLTSIIVILGFVIAVALMALLISVLIKSSTIFKDHKNIVSLSKPVIGLLTFVYCISLPLLQSKINKVVL